ncbi:MAG: hypothetical protein AAB403_03640 [Planctomycetota bacterium]
MNELTVGADKTPFLSCKLSGNVLFIDDGSLIDQLTIPARKKPKYFDIARHHINPLDGMDYKRAREFVSVMDAVYPEGESTLTKKNSNFILLNALLGNVSYLDDLLEPDKKDPARQDAYQKIETLLLSPVLRSVLCKPIDAFSLRGIVIARLDRAVLGDFDAFVLGSLLISMFKGQVVVPDFGFYGREHHVALIRQERLIAGVTTLSEVPEKLRQALLTIPKKTGSRTTYDDAEVLAKYLCVHARGANGYDEFIKDAMGG